MKKILEINPVYVSIAIVVIGLFLTIIDMVITGDQTGQSLTLLGQSGIGVFLLGLFYVPGGVLYFAIKNALTKKK